MKFAPLLVATFLAVTFAAAADTNWPEFRGPRGDGSTTSTVPLTWSETSHVKWKTAIHGKGWSSPVIWGGQIWLTTASEDARALSVLTIDAASGKILRDLKLFDVPAPQFIHPFNSPASPTPAIEDGRIYVTFGSPGIACLDTKTGAVLWTRRDFECNHFRGAGSSPIIWNDLLFLNFDGSDHQFIVALDKRTGKTVWRKERSIDFKDLQADGKPKADGDFRKAFATCAVKELNGVTTLLSQGASALYAYDPRTGDEFWRVEERTSHSASMRPLFGHGSIYVTTGFSQGQTLAVRPGKRGEVLDANGEAPAGSQLGIVWKSKKATPKKPALCLVGDRLFGVDDNGVATCWNAVSGEAIWTERVGGAFSASPLVAGDRIYCFNEAGKCTVIPTTGPFAKLAENQLDAGCLASPAVSGNAMFVRTKTSLYRIEE